MTKVDNEIQKQKRKADTTMRQELYDEEFKQEVQAAIDLLDDEYFFANLSGKVRVVNKRNPIEQTPDKDFIRFVSDLKIYKKIAKPNGDESIEVNPATYWIDKTKRFRGFTFDPSQAYGEIKDKFGYPSWNTFKGFNVTKAHKNGKSRGWRSHVYYNICKRNKAHYNYVMDWIADIFQHPTNKHPKILAPRGDHGAGKGRFIEAIRYLLSEYTTALTLSDLDGGFNGNMFQKLLAVADESLFSGNRAVISGLKKLSGDTTMTIESKGKDKFETNNYLRIIISTNDEWSVPKEEGDRRYVSWSVGTKHVKDDKYFGKIVDDMNNGGYEDLLYHLLNRKITTNFHSPAPDFDPETSKVQNIFTLESTNPVRLWLYSCQEEDVNQAENPVKLKGNHKATATYEYFINWCNTNNIYKKVSYISFGITMKKYVEKKRINHGGTTVYNFNNYINFNL